jgi:SAM-dependent methyltransferase
MDVVCTDLSPEMVKRCQKRGLDAHVMDFHHLDFSDEPFDAVYALNFLLHAPRARLPGVIVAIRDLVRPVGLFCWGQYGGIAREGVHAGAHYHPKRFFCLLSDRDIVAVGVRHFRLARSGVVALEADRDIHLQSMVWRRGGNPDPGYAVADTRG